MNCHAHQFKHHSHEKTQQIGSNLFVVFEKYAFLLINGFVTLHPVIIILYNMLSKNQVSLYLACWACSLTYSFHKKYIHIKFIGLDSLKYFQKLLLSCWDVDSDLQD